MPDDIESLRAELKAVIADRDAAKASGRDLASKVAQFEAEAKKAADAAEAEKKKREEDKLKRDGEYEELLKRRQTELDELRATNEKSLAKLRSEYAARLQTDIAPKAIAAALGKVANVAPSAVDDLVALLSGRVRVNQDTFEVFVCDAAGNPAAGADGKPITVDSLVSEAVKARPHVQLSTHPGGTAGAAGTNGTGRTAPTVPGVFGDLKRLQSDANYAAEWRKADADGCNKAWSQVLQAAASGGVGALAGA